jgi:hypothetical protein
MRVASWRIPSMSSARTLAVVAGAFLEKRPKR